MRPDLIIWSVKRLIQITIERNAFHVALGVCRFLYRYSTKETMALFDLVAQDAECRFEEDYYRARKKVLLHELLERFESRIELSQGRRREQMPETRAASGWRLRLVRECLERFTPWETRCVVPEGFVPYSDVIGALCSARVDSDRELRSVLRFRGRTRPTGPGPRDRCSASRENVYHWSRL